MFGSDAKNCLFLTRFKRHSNQDVVSRTKLCDDVVDATSFRHVVTSKSCDDYVVDVVDVFHRRRRRASTTTTTSSSLKKAIVTNTFFLETNEQLRRSLTCDVAAACESRSQLRCEGDDIARHNDVDSAPRLVLDSTLTAPL